MTGSWIVRFAAGALVVALGATAGAQIVGEGRPTPGQIDESAMITLDVSDRPLEELLDHFRTKVGVTIVTPPGTDGRVTIKLRDVPWTEALTLVAENAGCIVQQTSSKLWRVEKPPRVNMAFKAEDIKNVLEAIAKYGNANIVVSEKVKGNVTMVINDRPWRDALEAVVKTNGFYLVEEDRGILRVVDKAGLATHLDRRLFQLRYLRPKGTYIAKIDSDYIEQRQSRANQQTGGTTTGGKIEEQQRRQFPLLEALHKMLTEDGDLDYFDDQNAIVVRDTKPVLDEIGKFLERLDVEPVQIHIDVRVVTTSNVDSNDLAFGLDRGFTASISGASRTSRFPFNLGPGSFADNLLPGRDDDNASIGVAATSVVTPGTLDFSATSVAIRLVKRDQTAEIVQAPTITTVDHREATIFVGEQIRYPEADATAAQNGGLQITIKEAANSPVDTGFQLMVIPHVVPGTNRILMTVIPKALSLTGTSDPNLPGFDLFTITAGGLGNGSIELPRTGAQTIVTNMLLENGQTGIMGGLVQTTKSKDETKVPFLGDIPWVGNLFKGTNSRNDERKLLVFITPWIIGTSETTDDRLKRVIDAYKENAAREWDSMAAEHN